jgi:hypothetical protein
MKKALLHGRNNKIKSNSEVSYSWTIPSVLELPKILTKYPPSFSYKIDYFYHIIDSICHLMDFIDLTDPDNWAHLNSQQLQSFNHDYNNYLIYLKKRWIILVNRRYEVGKCSRGYKISPRIYSGEPIQIPVADYVVRKKLKKLGWGKVTVPDPIPGYEHLTKWFNDKLQIDAIGAINEVNTIFPIRNGRVINMGSWNKDGKAGRHKALRAINKLQNHEFSYKVDKNIGRFHSNLTCIKRELRNYITYDGHHLVNLDIKNSQPLFSGVLLQRNFYLEGGNSFNIHSIPSLNPLINNYSLFNKQISFILSYIMLVENEESLISIEFDRYLALIQSGSFYEGLGNLLRLTIPRRELKKLTYILFFSDNRKGPKMRLKENIFRSAFPTVHKVICSLKRHNKRILSHLLQRLESEIVIEKASRRIGIERPDLPIFSIHDSIATLEGQEDYVLMVLQEEIKKVTGLDATIGMEYWRPSVNNQQKAA